MGLRLAFKIAMRELRGGLGGFRVMLACLALGVASIAAVGTVRTSIESGLESEGARILGGDIELSLTHRFANAAERMWMHDQADLVSEVAVFRSMAVVSGDGIATRALTQIKAVDDNYPLIGIVELDPPLQLHEALAATDGLPGIVIKPSLAQRLGIGIGDTLRLGANEFRLNALIIKEPDSTGGDITLGPRSMVLTESLEGSLLMTEGTLFQSRYRLLLPADADIRSIARLAETSFAESGARWRDKENGAPGIQRFVDRAGTFLVLVGLAGLAIGGIGVSLAVSTYIRRKTEVIASLKTLGATQGTVFAVYLIQTGLVMLLALVIGLLLGMSIPLALESTISSRLPVPAKVGIYPGPLLEASLYGLLVGLIFCLWSLSAISRVRAATLFRSAVDNVKTIPGPVLGSTLLLLAGLLVACIAVFSGSMTLTLYFVLGITGTVAVLVAATILVRRAARSLARSAVAAGRPSLRLALGSTSGPSSGVFSAMLSLGLGLAVLATIFQIQSNLIGAISDDLPEIAPSYFVIDIQNTQIDEFRDLVQSIAGVSKLDTAPMLRGVITRINGQPAREVAVDHWVLRGDRGVSHAHYLPEGTTLVQGSWWPPDYDGQPLVSFAYEEGMELGLNIGDHLTVNLLGRNIEAEIASFREVDFSTAGMGFIMVMSPNALEGAPHIHLATIYADSEAEETVFQSVTSSFPNATAISVKEGIDNVVRIATGLVAGINYAALATLVVGFVVLIGTAANSVSARVYEAAVMKVLGATRWDILLGLTLRSAILGVSAGIVAILAGVACSWAVLVFVMEAEYSFYPLSALAVVMGGIFISLLAGMMFAYFPLSAKPARILHASE